MHALVQLSDGKILRLETFGPEGAPKLAAAKGVVWLPVVDEPPPEGVAAGSQLVVEAKRFRRVWAVQADRADQIRAQKLAEEAKAFGDVMAQGFPVTLQGRAETLQVARDVDKINWSRLQYHCLRAQAAGAGGQPLSAVGLLRLKTTSNAEYDLTVDETLAVLDQLERWTMAQMGKDWDVKRRLDAAFTPEAVRAIDVAAEWSA